VQKAVAGNQLRPLLIGAAVVAVLFVAIIVAGRYDRMARQIPPSPEVTAGRIQVEDTEVLPARGPAAGEPDADSGLPVQFYQVLGQGGADVTGGEIEMRPMPLPPPADAKPAASADKAATPTARSAPAAPPKPSTPAAAPAEAPLAKAVPPPGAAPPPAEGSEPAADRPYTLQVGSFSERDGADELAERLKGQGFSAYLLKVDLGGKGVWWRVRVGRYPTEYAAKWARLDLVKEGLSPIVVRDRAAATP